MMLTKLQNDYNKIKYSHTYTVLTGFWEDIHIMSCDKIYYSLLCFNCMLKKYIANNEKLEECGT